MAEPSDRFGLLRQHKHAARRYSEAARRFIGAPTIHRLLSHTVLDGAAIRSAILMGPNARHTSPSTFDAVQGPLAVTFDIIVLFARKSESMPSHPIA